MNVNIVVFFFASLGLLATLFFEAIQVFPKVAGAFSNSNSLGANSALRLMIFNRVGAVLYFPLLGFLVDNGASYREVASIGLVSVSIYLVLIAYLLSNFNYWLSAAANFFFTNNGARIQNKKESLNYKFIILSALAGAFGGFGLILPMLLGSVYSEYRLTLANMGFVFNSVFSLITIYIIDKKLAVLCDSQSDELISAAKSILLGRNLGSVFVLIVLSLIVLL